MDKNEDKDINLELKKIELSNTKFIESLKIITTGIVVTLIPALLSHNIQKQQVEIEKTKNELNYLMNFANDVVKENDLIKRKNFVEYLSMIAHSDESRERWQIYLASISDKVKELEEINQKIFEVENTIREIKKQTDLKEANEETKKQLSDSLWKLENLKREKSFLIEGAKLQDVDTDISLETPKKKSSIPEAAIKLIQEFEGLELSAYPDPLTGSFPYAIGYNTIFYPDGTAVQPNDSITTEKAKEYLIENLEKSFKPQLEKIPNWEKMNQNQQAALYSFAYNLGAGFYGAANFSSITNVLKKPEVWKDKSEIEKTFLIYTNPGSTIEAGLRKRRLAEANVFLSPE